MNNAPDGILSLDAEGRVVSMNPAAAQMLDCDVDHAVRESLGDISPELCSRLE